MWLVKGMLSGLGVFAIGFIIYLAAKLRPIEATKATSANLLVTLTASNIWFWIALVLCLAVGCYLLRPHVAT